MHEPGRWFPLLVVAGMSRAGTTFLYHNLRKHPAIFAPARKEICYFGHHHDRGFDWFRSFYDGMKPGETGLDVCGLYFMEPESIDRLLAYDPEQRVILGLRSPREWIFSLYEQYSGNFDVPPLRDFLSGAGFQREGREIAFELAPGFVRRTVEQYAAAFGERLLLFDFRLLGADPLALLRAIESFAGLEPWFEPGRFTDSKINARGRIRSERLERLLQVRGVANAIARVVPRRLLLAVRGWIDARSSRHAEPATAGDPPRYTDGELAAVETLFRVDSAWMDRLFAGSPVRRGNEL